MKLTLKKDGVFTTSLITKHEILSKASALVMGREGVLQTEKDLYLVMSFVAEFIEEDLIDLCNTDERPLNTIFIDDIEPLFNSLMENEKNKILYDDVRVLFLDRCKEIWDIQHSAIGILDTLFTTIASMSEEDRKEVLAKTGEMAEKAFDRRTQIMESKVDEANSKLENFVKKYEEAQKIEQTNNAE